MIEDDDNTSEDDVSSDYVPTSPPTLDTNGAANDLNINMHVGIPLVGNPLDDGTGAFGRVTTMHGEITSDLNASNMSIESAGSSHAGRVKLSCGEPGHMIDSPSGEDAIIEGGTVEMTRPASRDAGRSFWRLRRISRGGAATGTPCAATGRPGSGRASRC